jgi:SAM-dependent methyltransferase
MAKETETDYRRTFPFERLEGARLSFPSAVRNAPFILDVLRRVLPKEGTVLEIASGSGQHAAAFAPELKPLVWLPSDGDSEKLASIRAWREAKPAPNLRAPIRLDAGAPRWPIEDAPPTPPIAAIVAVNLLNVSPWRVGASLLKGAGRILKRGGVLVFYGAFKVDGRHTTPSNEAFDRMLQEENPEWGVRDLNQVTKAAAAEGLELRETVPMPANNLLALFERV